MSKAEKIYKEFFFFLQNYNLMTLIIHLVDAKFEDYFQEL